MKSYEEHLGRSKALSRSGPRARRRSVVARLGAISTVIMIGSGCNVILGNEERLLDDTIDTTPLPRKERDGAFDLSDGDMDGGARDDADADADAPDGCPAIACTSALDCAANELCFAVPDGISDGGVVARFCGAACDAGTGCSGDRKCTTASSPMTMHCTPKAPVCGRVCDWLCGESCVDLQTDPRNCGLCGSSCPATKVCRGGACS